MKIEMIENKLENLGYWVLYVEENLYQLQIFETGEILEQKYNIEGLQFELERIEQHQVENIDTYWEQQRSIDNDIYATEKEIYEIENEIIDEDELY